MIRVAQNKLKRFIILALVILLAEIILTSMTVFKQETNKTIEFLEATKDLETVYPDEISLLCMDNEVMKGFILEDELEYIYDEVDALFDKFEVRYELRDFTRSLCVIYNIDPIVFISLIQIESHFGKATGYNSYAEYRTYGDGYADIGLGQLSSRYFDYFEEAHFNPELLMSLGYVRNDFRAEDDYINLQVSASYLSYLVIKCEGDYEKAIMSYNCGETKVRKGDIPQLTLRYARAILNSQRYLEGNI